MKRNLLPFFLIGGVLLVGAIMIVALSLSGEPGADPKKDQDSGVETFEIQGRDHIEVGVAHDPYNSNPPTSGPHYAEPADWGVYEQELPDERLVHNLEHGGIWISHKGIDAEIKSKLEEFGRMNPGSVIVTPRAANDAPIVLASWGKLLKLQSWDEDRVQRFLDTNKNQAPEPLAR
jgi:hypothetical protein